MALSDTELKKLTEKAWQIRKDIIQTLIWSGGGHAGGALSQVEILVCLYYKYLNIDPKRPNMADRDRVVLSKGHGGIGMPRFWPTRGISIRSSLRTSTTRVLLRHAPG